METCYACGRTSGVDGSLAEGIKGAVKQTWADGWEAVWDSCEVGHEFALAGGVVTLVSMEGEYPEGYDTSAIYMIFRDWNDNHWKVKGGWSSYNGQVWEDDMSLVEKKERVVEYYE